MCFQCFAVPSRVIHLQICFCQAVGGNNRVPGLGGSDAVVGFDVSPHDVEGLAAAIARTQEPSLRATMIEEGLKWAQRFTEEQMARETMECYRKVLTKET